MGVGKRRVDNLVIHQIANAVGQLLDNDSSGTGKKTRRDADNQHETAVGHVRRPPYVEAVNPSVDSILEFTHDCSRFSAAKIGKSNKRIKKKQLFPYFRSINKSA